MALPDRRQKPVRFLPEQVSRLERAVKLSGSTEQAYMATAIMQRVEDDLARQGEASERRRDAREGRRGRDGEEPMGLGLRRRVVEPAPAPPAAPQGVVVNVGPGAGGSDAVTRLAAWVMAGPGHREPRLREGAEILKASASSKEEGEQLAGQLEAAVAQRSQQEQKKGGLAALLRGDGLFSFKDLLGS